MDHKTDHIDSYTRRAERKAQLLASKKLDVSSTLVIVGYPAVIEQNDINWRAQLHPPLGMNKYDCRLLLSDMIPREKVAIGEESRFLSLQSQQNTSNLQFKRYQTLLRLLANGASEQDILKLSSTAYNSKNSESMEILSPTQFEQHKKAITEQLLNSRHSVPSQSISSNESVLDNNISMNNSSILSDSKVDEIAAQFGIKDFCRLIGRKNSPVQEDFTRPKLSKTEKKYLKREKMRYQLHLNREQVSILDGEQNDISNAQSSSPKKETPNDAFVIEIDEGPLDGELIEDHLSSRGQHRSTKSLENPGDFERPLASEKPINSHNSSSRESDFTSKIIQRHFPNLDRRRAEEAEIPVSNPRSSTGLDERTSKSSATENRSFNSSKERKYTDSPPKKKVYQGSSGSAPLSKLDKMLADLERKHKK